MADTTIVFLGLKMEVAIDDVPALESRSFPLLVSARQAGLEHYWGNFESPNERYSLFIGKLLGRLGIEDQQELGISPQSLVSQSTDIAQRLRDAGMPGVPVLYVELQRDS
jgi:hypothetical protein